MPKGGGISRVNGRDDLGTGPNGIAAVNMRHGNEAQATVRTWIAIAASMMGAFMAILDIQITNSSLRDILGTLSATQDEGSWISTAYLVAEIIMIPLTAFLSRVFGVQRYLIYTTALFLIASTLCATAWNLPSMVTFRALQGFFGGGLIPIAMTLVATQLPPTKRAIGMAMFGLTASLAPTIGPTLGGYLSEMFGWPSIFYLNWIPGTLLAVGVGYGLDGEPIQSHLWGNADWRSMMFMALGLGSLIVFLEEGNRENWFESVFIIVFAELALFGLIGWVLSNRASRAPFVNLNLFLRPNFLVAAVLSAVTGVALYGSNFLVPLFLAQIQVYTPMQIGEVLLWAGLPQILVMPLAARLSSRVDNRIVCSVGLALFGISCMMNTYMDATTGYDQFIASQVVRALGQPLILLTLSNFSLHGISPKDTASASSLFNMIRNLGGSVGIALLMTALTNREHVHSAHIGESVSLASAATQLRLDQLAQLYVLQGGEPSSTINQALGTVDALVRREAFVMAYNDSFLIMGIVLLAGIVFLWASGPVRISTDSSGLH